MNKTILIDLDITLFNTDEMWFKWLDERGVCSRLSLIDDQINSEVSYDISKYFTLPEDVKPFDFWSEGTTYEDCQIHPHAVDVITQLYKAGFKIIFCTYCMQCGVQFENKSARIAKEFSHIDYSFVATKDKGVVKCDYFIDDRHSFINQTDAKGILYSSPYEQDEPLTKEVITIESWLDIEQYFIDEILENF